MPQDKGCFLTVVLYGVAATLSIPRDNGCKALKKWWSSDLACLVKRQGLLMHQFAQIDNTQVMPPLLLQALAIREAKAMENHVYFCCSWMGYPMRRISELVSLCCDKDVQHVLLPLAPSSRLSVYTMSICSAHSTRPWWSRNGAPLQVASHRLCHTLSVMQWLLVWVCCSQQAMQSVASVAHSYSKIRWWSLRVLWHFSFVLCQRILRNSCLPTASLPSQQLGTPHRRNIIHCLTRGRNVPQLATCMLDDELARSVRRLCHRELKAILTTIDFAQTIDMTPHHFLVTTLHRWGVSLHLFQSPHQ